MLSKQPHAFQFERRIGKLPPKNHNSCPCLKFQQKAMDIINAIASLLAWTGNSVARALSRYDVQKKAWTQVHVTPFSNPVALAAGIDPRTESKRLHFIDGTFSTFGSFTPLVFITTCQISLERSENCKVCPFSLSLLESVSFTEQTD
jgi:hypothetical protein